MYLLYSCPVGFFLLLPTGFFLFSAAFSISFLFRINQFNRTVIGTGNVGKNRRLAYHGKERIINTMIVNTPSDVFFSCMKAIAPPGILMRFGTKMPERIGIPSLRKSVHPCPLLRQIAGILLICFGIGKIDGLVRNVIVSAEYDMPSFFLQRMAAQKSSL